MLTCLLVANPSEAACRIMRMACRLGIRTVTAYSDADAKGLRFWKALRIVLPAGSKSADRVACRSRLAANLRAPA